MTITIKNDIKYNEKKTGILKVAEAFIDWNKMPIGSYFECQSKEEFQKLRSNASTFGVRLSMRFADETYKKCYAFRIPYESTDKPLHDVFGSGVINVEKIEEKPNMSTYEELENAEEPEDAVVDQPKEEINLEYKLIGITQHDHDLDIHFGGYNDFTNMELEQRHKTILGFLNGFIWRTYDIGYQEARKYCSTNGVLDSSVFHDNFKDYIIGVRE